MACRDGRCKIQSRHKATRRPPTWIICERRVLGVSDAEEKRKRFLKMVEKNVAGLDDTLITRPVIRPNQISPFGQPRVVHRLRRHDLDTVAHIVIAWNTDAFCGKTEDPFGGEMQVLQRPRAVHAKIAGMDEQVSLLCTKP